MHGWKRRPSAFDEGTEGAAKNLESRPGNNIERKSAGTGVPRKMIPELSSRSGAIYHTAVFELVAAKALDISYHRAESPRVSDHWGMRVSEEAVGGSPDLIELAGDIVAAYVSNNHLQPTELPSLIASVYAAVVGLSGTTAAQELVEEVEKPTPAQIRKSITDDGIVSFLDGKRYKTLKRHLTGHGLDPRSYRERYGLPADYPMVAPSYAAQRAAIAKQIGLGRPGALAERQAEPEPPQTSGRRRKTG